MKKQKLLLYAGMITAVVMLIAVIVMAIMGTVSFPWQNRTDETANGNAEETMTLFAMNTYMTITAHGSRSASALQAVESRIGELESLWSVTDSRSEIYRLNHNRGVPLSVDGVTLKVVSFALGMAERTGGTLEPTIYPVLTEWGFTTGSYRVPTQAELDSALTNIGHERVVVDNGQITLPEGMQLDLGAVAKGYTADIAQAILKEHGITSALIDLGGNLQLIGTKPDGSRWRVGIKDPYGDGNVGVLEAANCAVVTSGGYERFFVGDDGQSYWHILDPSTGRPSDSGLISVTVVGMEGRTCDALSTALYVMGVDGATEHWRTYQDFEMILMTEDNELYITEGLEYDFTLSQGHAGMPIQIIKR